MITLETIAIVVTGIIAIAKLNQSIKQNRNKDIVMFYEKTQEIRENLNTVKNDEKEKAESLIKQLLNLNDILAYSVLNSTVNEKDAFRLLKNNIKSVRKKFVTNIQEHKDYNNIVRLVQRWDNWGLSKYYLKKLFNYIVVLVGVMLIAYIYT